MSTPNETATNPFDAITPPIKGKEKKRVGWSQGNSTPHQAQSVPGSAGEGGGAGRSQAGHASHDEDRTSHDGVDHHELTRALTRILSNEKLQRGTENSPPGEQSGAAASSHPPHEPALSPVPAVTVLAEPTPPYFPPARQQQQEQSEKAARERADRLAQSVERDYSNPASRAESVAGGSGGDDDDEEAAAAEGALFGLRRRRWRSGTISGNGVRDHDDDHDEGRIDGHDNEDDEEHQEIDPHMAAQTLVRSHTRGHVPKAAILSQQVTDDTGFHYDAAMAHSGNSTPGNTFGHDTEEYVPPPNKYNGGILSSLLRLYNHPNASASNSAANSERSTPTGTPASSRPPSPGPGDGTETPKRRSGFFGKKVGKPHEHDGTHTPKTKGQPWGVFHPNHKHSHSTTSLTAGLLGTSSILASTGSAGIGQAVTERVKRERPPLKRNRHSASSIFTTGSPKFREGSNGGGGRRRRREEEQMRITKHIAEVLSRHRYLTLLCRALMMYGAPTHRLEDYLKMSARVLEIEAQFLYIPGCMLVSFDDSSTHTAEVKLVRAPQGVDLGKLSDVHAIYKEVIHDHISVDEAISLLNGITSKPPKYKVWMRIPVYGLASACVAPFAFGGRFIDIPMCFVLGCVVGMLALIAAPSNAFYSNVFEITAAVITSFLARAIGSIAGGKIFCFSALAQSAIALILPGYMVLCSSLELQSQNIVAGSVRMVYAMIYTLFLGYGITIGTAVYGAIDSTAVSTTNCTDSLSRPWYFLFVPFFTICLCIINQAKWRQMPIMVLISLGGFAVTSYASSYFSNNAQIPNSLGALCIGILANVYARTSPYFERYVAPLRAKYFAPLASSIGRRKKRLSRRDGQGAGDDYFDMPPYRKGEESRAEEGAIRLTKSNSSGNERTAAEMDADKAKAEKKAPGSHEVIGYGLAAAAMLPAIFVQVPSGLAVNGSLLSGINAANDLTGNSSTSHGSGNSTDSSAINNVSFTVLLSVIQVAIGITVGLFFAAIIVYPLGKRRSALFSF
ncbi:uncharacterized protein SPSK_06975 [Sporothrix schenckii 1099-18]|uniref:Threonine/serine exporter-like N-terminal domain-containing protein n=2 Tax=Sporothrix schenckii TaxID=29908 RepID=U7PZN4_SPOS1|nr:uncharacterized protein SPSK_06975 [Sporothrix schenckii 1099-18]ERT01068.1 hypothetical protein HMPREF1624_02305 [Sporothrix schenckii ATCC 58251]KJR88200.1 hypothetical protein SPSK_06975 [Sporothrix schenckii 1099-18]